MAAWDFSFHCMYNYQIFFFCGSILAETNGPKNELRSAGQEEVGRRRNDDVLAPALLIFKRWEMANSDCVYHEEYRPC